MAVAFFVGAQDIFSQAGRRDLKDYKRGPSFDLQGYHLPEGNQEKAPVRDLLWKLWTSRTKGFFDVTLYTREGAPTKYRFFVEPDLKGRWRVATEYHVTVCPYSSRERCRRYLRTTYSINYDMVERIEYDDVVLTSSGPARPHRQIPDNEGRDPLKFVLVLKDSNTGRKSEL